MLAHVAAYSPKESRSAVATVTVPHKLACFEPLDSARLAWYTGVMGSISPLTYRIGCLIFAAKSPRDCSGAPIGHCTICHPLRTPGVPKTSGLQWMFVVLERSRAWTSRFLSVAPSPNPAFSSGHMKRILLPAPLGSQAPSFTARPHARTSRWQ